MNSQLLSSAWRPARRTFLKMSTSALTMAALRKPAQAEVGLMGTSLASKLKDKCVGYAFTISDKYGAVYHGAGGEARRPQDPPIKAMSTSEKFPVASVSKTITAAALIRLLWTTAEVNLDSAFFHFLPPHWTVHSSLKNITFTQLLNHHSGFRFNGQDYFAIKSAMVSGVLPVDIGTYSYNNMNYAIMRLLIPRVAKATVTSVPPGSSPDVVSLLEPIEDFQLASVYMSYVQKTVWDKTGIAPGMSCASSVSNPGLCYQFPYTDAHGTDFGNMILTCGAQGWRASASQLNAFLRTLHFSTEILPEWLSNKMIDEHLGYDGVGTANNGISYYHKRGKHSGAGELRSLVMGFANGVHIGLIMNSQLSGSMVMPKVVEAFEETYL